MSTPTEDLTRRMERLPKDLQAEFPGVPLEVIKRDVDQGARQLVAAAKFDDFVPLLVHKAIRDRLRSVQKQAEPPV